MFGYLEPAYVVLKSETLTVRQGTQHFEMRQAGAELAYLALEIRDRSGQVTGDYLLKYDDEAKLQADWDRLVSDLTVSLSSLAWVDKVVDHATGYGRDGSVTLY